MDFESGCDEETYICSSLSLVRSDVAFLFLPLSSCLCCRCDSSFLFCSLAACTDLGTLDFLFLLASRFRFRVDRASDLFLFLAYDMI